MKRLINKIFLLAFLSISLVSCKKYLDINTDVDTPQNPDPTSVFPTQLAGIPRGTQYDARYLAKYIQNWLTGANANANTWDLHGYASGSDAAGDIWRQCYYGMGKNLEYIITESEKQERWDVAGAGLALKCLIFQLCTDYHGDIGIYGLYNDEKVFYNYTSQDTVYRWIDSLALRAIDYLRRPVNTASGYQPLSRGDYSYSGNTTKWRKFVFGIRARNWSHQINKSTFNADSVISFCDSSLSDIAGGDDMVVPFDATKNDDSNFFGPYRDNMIESSQPFRASNFIVRLLDGTTLVGNTTVPSRDPRLRHMLSMSADSVGTTNGGYRGVDPGLGDPNSAATSGTNFRRRAAALWGDSLNANPSAATFTTGAGKYLFKDKAVHPVMTYSEIQFIKAEALLKKADKTNALTAYRNGIQGHLNFINKDVYPRGGLALYRDVKITTAEMNAYLNTSGAVKTVASNLTLTDVMLQKYIALWGWGFVETWCDLRKYHYNKDLDPSTGLPVYKSFTLPATYFSNNGGKPVQRVRPRFNSEYVWNVSELTRIGAMSLDYHTKPMWFSEP